MGHIANKIDAKDKKLTEVLNGQRYRIDAFQREYRWQRKHIEALISDLTTSFLNNYDEGHQIDDYDQYDCYYMGPIVLCEDKNELSIVDGQQRLTSFTLLLIFLNHAQSHLELGKNQLRDLNPFFYVTKAGKRTLVLNVETRRKVIEHLLQSPDTIYSNVEEFDSKEQDGRDIQYDQSVLNIIDRYEDITKLFPEDILSQNKLPLFVEWLLEKVLLVEVKAYSMENAYTIFETMNDRGMTLSPTEILKGFLLSKINDEEKSDEMNEFWKSRIAEINSQTDGDLDFFRAWLRAKYAVSIRTKQSGAENEDFELIGTQFNSWVKNNPSKTFLKSPDDYYFFIQSDFDFYSSLYIKIYSLKETHDEDFDIIYIANFYPLADSIFYPLMLSPISKIDDEKVIDEKLVLVANFIDCYTNVRSILSKPITQSTIRYSMYDFIKNIRNLDVSTLKEKLFSELEKSMNEGTLLSQFHQMDNWGYYHYFFARILYYLNTHDCNFVQLMRSKRQSSFVLARIFETVDKPEEVEDGQWEMVINSVANYCLVRRHDIETIETKRSPATKLKYLLKQDYLPELTGVINISSELFEFIQQRDAVLRDLASDIWNLSNV
ncbi:uncharacterized protein with ParB-like and HNH nuclease domain [Mucilaginibacter oryzae]|uniref:Uncharacterized protein with ParB-like and HNH nuclease domain n=1 Tax=Mucilaginibacter oryzae TaxID=468058 RepID=A0A316HCI1_9SPHI|nr:DUF262 domain-containing protein [Mucilaginibacter oryzae]PWK78228.1 uncharacterized protein with ParB-like and HNH nuclease domain [Mucilaginibacter oryzae]